MKAYLITAIVISGLAVLLRGGYLVQDEYPRIKKCTRGADAFDLIVSLAYIFWAALLLSK